MEELRFASIAPREVQIIQIISVAANNTNDNNNNNNSSSWCMHEERILSDDCLRIHARGIARAFPFVKHWCVPSTNLEEIVQNENEEWQGLLLVKVPKSASSTVAGLTYHLHNSSCAVQGSHYETHKLKGPYLLRDVHRSFLFAPIRRPASHDLSFVEFFRFASLNKEIAEKNRTANEYKKGLLGKGGHHQMRLTSGTGGYQFNYIRHRPREVLVSSETFQYAKIHAALREEFGTHYGFFLVTERMDESIVAFANILGLRMRDVVIPSNAKVRDGQYSYSWNLKKCVRYPTYPSPPVEFLDYLESPEYKRITYADQLLYLAANYSLDLTIEHSIGSEKFANDLAEFRTLKSRVQDYCGERLGSGCHKNGTVIKPREKCYLRDFGCGYECVNGFMEQNK